MGKKLLTVFIFAAASLGSLNINQSLPNDTTATQARVNISLGESAHALGEGAPGCFANAYYGCRYLGHPAWMCALPAIQIALFVGSNCGYTFSD